MGAKNKSAIFTLVEPRYVMWLPLKNRYSARKSIKMVFKNRSLPLKKLLYMKKMKEQKRKNSKMKIYFPYNPWERRTNENWNGLIWKFFAKSIDFSRLNKYKILKFKKENKDLSSLIRFFPKNLLFCTRIVTPK